jgi:adenylate kinase
MSSNIIIFIGPPGSGKGSLSHLCVKDLGWVQLSTGSLCRKHIAQNSPIGEKIDFAIKSGKLIEDDLIVSMVSEWLEQNNVQNEYIILDGFPRTIAQAEALDKLLRDKFASVQIHTVKLDVSSETVIKRLSARFICPNDACQAVYSTLADSNLKSQDLYKCDECSRVLVSRSDDTIEAIKERLVLYYAYEQMLIDYYKHKNQFIGEINVEQSLSTVFQDFKLLLDNKVPHDNS